MTTQQIRHTVESSCVGPSISVDFLGPFLNHTNILHEITSQWTVLDNLECPHLNWNDSTVLCGI